MSGRRSEQMLTDLVRDRGEALTRYAYLLTGDVAAAQDLVQDALVKVFVRTRTGFAPDVMEAYVRRAIVNVYLDTHRRTKQWTGVQHLGPDHTSPRPEAGTPDRIDLRAALATLAPQERTAVVLRFLADLTVPEIADQMGIGQGSIKRYLSNAIGKLEQRLGPLPTLRTRHDTTVVHAISPSQPPIVALTSAGDVLVLDPNSGEIPRTHATVGDETPFGWAPVTTDQAFAYLVRDDEVRRVDLTNGAVEVVAPGYAPAISPDGKLLAYIGPDESGDRTTDALWLVDQETGARHSLSAIAETELELPRPSWSRDGATLYLSYDLEPDIRAVPIAADGTPLTDEATTLRAPRGEDGYATAFWSLATSLPDGDLVRVSAPAAYDSPPSEISVQRVSLTTGSTTTIEELSGTEIVGMAAAPQGGALVAVVATRDGDRLRYTLVRWDAQAGVRALADDVVGVAW